MAACGNCGSSALVQWVRRPTADELAAIPDNQGGATATAENTTVAVYACGSHAISQELAGLVHQAVCAGPTSTVLPNCTCAPVPWPESDPEPTTGLPAGWV
jgi:hypothetical protein